MVLAGACHTRAPGPGQDAAIDVTSPFLAGVGVGSGSGISLGDFDRDGRVDVAFFGAAGGGFVMRNATVAGSRTLSFDSPVKVFDAAPWLAAVDLKGDGAADLLWGTFLSGLVMRLDVTPPGGAMTFGAATGLAGGSMFHTTWIQADFNSDGLLDFIDLGGGTGTPTMYLNVTHTIDTVASFTGALLPKAPITGAVDINADGRPDLVEGGAIALNIMESTSPTYAAPVTVLVCHLDAVGSSVIVDFDRDGRPDLACTDASGSNTVVALNTTPVGASVPSFTAPVSVPGTIEAVFDVDGDDTPDLIVGGDSTSILLNTTVVNSRAPSFAPPVLFDSSGPGNFVGAADFDGDGTLDLVFVGVSEIDVFMGTNSPGARLSYGRVTITLDAVSSGMAAVVRIGDLNDDGKPDLLAASGGALTAYLTQ